MGRGAVERSKGQVEVFGVEGANDGNGVCGGAQDEGQCGGGAGLDVEELEVGAHAAVGQANSGGEEVGAGIKGYAFTVGGRFGILVRVAGGEGVQEGGFLRVGEELQLVLFVEAREGEVGVVFGVGQVRGGV